MHRMTDAEWEKWSERMQADYDNNSGYMPEAGVMPTGQEGY